MTTARLDGRELGLLKGHIRWRHSSWYIVYNEPQEDAGTVKQRWRSGFRTRQEAEEALSLLQDTLNPRGRPPRTDSEYERIAQIYIAKLATRTETNRNSAGIAAEMAAEADMPKGTMKGWLHEARQRGFLSNTTAVPTTPAPETGKARSELRSDGRR